MKNHNIPFLELTADAKKIHCFFPLLQHGFGMEIQAGCSVRSLLCEKFGLNPDYVEDRIRTVFLDGKAVDDLDRSVVRDGATLALSAAMPGLVGSTFRRGSYLASFRSTITCPQEQASPLYGGKGTVILKLFNLTVTELGPAFLKQGIRIRKNELEEFLKLMPEDFRTGCKSVIKDGTETTADELPRMTWSEQETSVLLTVHLYETSCP